ncbi:hypothetical protein AB0L80_34470 [Streptomyces sp. NPDC052069]|uniref:hypothetical protein n=1 Tax=Streptomyces sp. NPDC052069 TaxID=3154650 RepID=UPI00341E62F5
MVAGRRDHHPESLCAPDLSRPEYVATESTNLALVTVTGTIGYLEKEPELPGGVQTVKARIDTALKGGSSGTLALGQSVDVKRDGQDSTAGADNRYDVLRPGHPYIVSFCNGGSYVDGYVLYSEDAPDPSRAIERWTGHICEDPLPGPRNADTPDGAPCCRRRRQHETTGGYARGLSVQCRSTGSTTGRGRCHAHSTPSSARAWVLLGGEPVASALGVADEHTVLHDVLLAVGLDLLFVLARDGSFVSFPLLVLGERGEAPLERAAPPPLPAAATGLRCRDGRPWRGRGPELVQALALPLAGRVPALPLCGQPPPHIRPRG